MTITRIIGFILFILLLLVITGAVGYKIIAPSSKTVVQKGGRQIIVNTDKPQTPISGCSIWRVNMKAYWENNIQSSDQLKDKK